MEEGARKKERRWKNKMRTKRRIEFNIEADGRGSKRGGGAQTRGRVGCCGLGEEGTGGRGGGREQEGRRIRS